ncbi:Protein kinase domain-containing protein [Fusarium sp. Ph1]|nr:Protein kinase domain-containing protein [Fusarium sp. Ph1]
MTKQMHLKNLGFSPDSIWGDKNETVVYAQVFGVRLGSVPIFRFYRNPRQSPKSLANRIINFYHDINVHDDALSFPNRAAMRSAIWSSIATVWSRCATDPNAFTPGTVIDLSSDDKEGFICDLVPPADSALTIDITKVDLLKSLGRRGCTKGAHVRIPAGTSINCFFKGIDFATYLQFHDDDNEIIRSMVETWRRSSKLVADMPPHPNIQPLPEMIVSIRDSNGNEVLMGHLSTLYKQGDLALVIEKANSGKTQILLKDKAGWCYEMSRVVAHTHRFLHTFHMDINPGNFLVRPWGELLLIDWEQSGAPATTLAPEADGTWDVNEEATDEGTRLVYSKYTGPPRCNMPKGSEPATFHSWNVFPEWQATFPRATELAEVFSLGRTMWMLLTQTVGGFDEVKHPNDVRVTWDVKHNIPPHWIEMVERCMEKDPNERPHMEDLVKFWKLEESLLDRKP